MYLKEILILFLLSLFFENIPITFSMEMNEMSEKGKIQYQLLQERASLPQYGDCWKNAIRKVNDGCKQLSEEAQAEIALHLTNCFLLMSGHEIYNCEADKKPNLRGICISTMSDRAFHVYTEFFTHTLNICYFLKGLMWHETIAENTVKLGKQLYDSAVNLEELLLKQRESIQLQESTKEFFIYLKEKHKNFDVLTSNFKDLQSWLLIKTSWLDNFLFYFITSSLTMYLTSLKQTGEARFLMLVTITLHMLIERIIGSVISSRIINLYESNQIYYYVTYFLRLLTVIILLFLLIYFYFNHKDYLIDNNVLLRRIDEKVMILDKRINEVSLLRNIIMENHEKCDGEIQNNSIKEDKVEKYQNGYKNDVKSSLSRRYNLRNLTKNHTS